MKKGNRRVIAASGGIIALAILVITMATGHKNEFIGEWSSSAEEEFLNLKVGKNYIEAFGKRLPVRVTEGEDGSFVAKSANQEFMMVMTGERTARFTVKRQFEGEEREGKIYELKLK